MSRIFVIDAERRNWARRIRSRREGDVSVFAVTRRYLMIVEQPALRDVIHKEFSTFPNAIHPHESGKDFMFYCIAGPSCRRPKRLVDSLFHKLRKNDFPESELENLEVLTA